MEQAALFSMAPMVKRAAAPAVRYGRTPVPPEVLAAGVGALEHFNAATGRECRAFTERGRLSESLSRIIGAMLDFPEVQKLAPTMIDAALRDPWWTGPASTGVVFGPNVVERSIEQAKRPTAAPIRGTGAMLRALAASERGAA